jgi:carboxypeptidase C (cathepsin A)
MKKALGLSVLAILFATFTLWSPAANAQATQSATHGAEAKAAEAKPPASSAAPKEESSVTDHTVRIGNETVPYKATAGTILIKDDKGEPTASIFYIAYTRSDVKDMSTRPLAFLYNGGPGSSSIWIHMGAYGPERVVTTDAATTPPAPYKLVDNQYSLIDKCDEVFIDPVGTGFSHAVGKAQNKDFWGVDSDVRSLAQFIYSYISRNDRWNSPKFLIGESYGTFRSVALGNYLQSHDGMYLNGIVLMSNVLDLGTISFYPGEDLTYELYVPSYAATACYHKVITCPADLTGFLQQAREFAGGEYADALMKGDTISDTEKAAVAKKLSQFTGLSEDYLMKADLRVNLPQFMAELQRSRGLDTGRLDARFSGYAVDPLAEFAEYDPQSVALEGAFTAAFNEYVRQDLKFGENQRYNVAAQFNGAQWDWKHNQGRGFGFPGAPNVEPDLVEALVTNPDLKVEVENGLYDLATPFFETEYEMEHLGLPKKLQGNITLKYYDSGHMMYVHPEALAKLSANVHAFIESASK